MCVSRQAHAWFRVAVQYLCQRFFWAFFAMSRSVAYGNVISSILSLCGRRILDLSHSTASRDPRQEKNGVYKYKKGLIESCSKTCRFILAPFYLWSNRT